tara:strand:- start:5464 stop:5895 length:432 start_codon:yes stop_codon:yes gene_type:complete
MNALLIHETEHCTMVQASGYRLPGYVIVELKAPCTHVSRMPAEVAADFYRCVALAESLVQDLIEPERIYLMKFGEMVPQVHVHVVPRTAELQRAYLAEVEDKPPCNGARVVDWLWAQHATLGHTDEAIASFVDRARAHVASAE